MTLIQIISGETLQNVLPILALRPSRVISVVSQVNPMFLSKIGQIEDAVVAAKHSLNIKTPIEFFSDLYSSDCASPTIEDFRRAVSRALSEHENCCVNYTGGTKNMGIGAWLAAQEDGAPTVYCDSPRSFSSGGTGEIAYPIQLQDVARRLDIATILAAQGLRKGEHWKVYNTSGARIAFGRISYELWQEAPGTVKRIQQHILEHGNAGGKRPDAKDVVRAQKFAMRLPEGPVVARFLDAALKAGLVIHRKDGWYLALDQKGPIKALKYRLEKTLMQLTGGAYEGFIHDRLEKSSRFSAFLHSVMPVGKSEDSSFGETDFLAFEPSKARLVLISCKSSAPSLEHLEATLARKAHLGGRFADAILCIKSVADPKREREIRRQSSTLGIECLIGSEVDEAFLSQTN